MDKVEVKRDQLLYLIRTIDRVRKDHTGLAATLDHVVDCLGSMAGVYKIQGNWSGYKVQEINKAKRDT